MSYRRTITVLLALLLVLFSCTREDGLATVTFGVDMYQSGVMTKVDAGAVAEALSVTTPSGPFALHATSTTNNLRSYNITTGVPITMAVDSYTVTGSGTGEFLAQVTGGGIYATPSWSVNSDVSVTSGGGSINVSASYTCIAIVWDKSVVSSITFTNGADEVTGYAVGGTDEIAVVYVSGNWTPSKPLYIFVRPVDMVNYEVRQYLLCSSSSEGKVWVRNGRWYAFTPGSIETASGTLGMTFNSWINGN